MAMLSQGVPLIRLGCPAGFCRGEAQPPARSSWRALAASFAAGALAVSTFVALSGEIAAPYAPQPDAAREAAAARWAAYVHDQTPRELPREWRWEIKPVRSIRCSASSASAGHRAHSARRPGPSRRRRRCSVCSAIARVRVGGIRFTRSGSAISARPIATKSKPHQRGVDVRARHDPAEQDEGHAHGAAHLPRLRQEEHLLERILADHLSPEPAQRQPLPAAFSASIISASGRRPAEQIEGRAAVSRRRARARRRLPFRAGARARRSLVESSPPGEAVAQVRLAQHRADRADAFAHAAQKRRAMSLARPARSPHQASRPGSLRDTETAKQVAVDEMPRPRRSPPRARALPRGRVLVTAAISRSFIARPTGLPAGDPVLVTAGDGPRGSQVESSLSW